MIRVISTREPSSILSASEPFEVGRGRNQIRLFRLGRGLAARQDDDGPGIGGAGRSRRRGAALAAYGSLPGSPCERDVRIVGGVD
jgi:hypothetical protein